MHQTRKPPTWYYKFREKFSSAAYFVFALLLHIIVLLLVATVVIFKAPAPPQEDFKPVNLISVKQPPPPPAESSPPAAPLLEPDPDPTPLVSPVSVVTTTQSSFKFDVSSAAQRTLTSLEVTTPKGGALTVGTPGQGNAAGQSVFGTLTGGSDQMEGYFFDLKQAPDHSPTGMDEGGSSCNRR